MKCSQHVRSGFLALTLALGIGAADAQAQFPYSGTGSSGQYRPAFSPYLNLLRQGNSPAINYYGIVRPQFEFQNSINGIQQQVSLDTQSINNIQTGALPTTGHSARFQNLGGYFQTSVGGAGTNTSANNRSLTGLQAQGLAGFNQGQFGSNQGLQNLFGGNSGLNTPRSKR